MDFEEMYELLLGYELFTEDELNIAIVVGGANADTMERLLFYRTGWRSFDGWLDEYKEEE